MSDTAVASAVDTTVYELDYDELSDAQRLALQDPSIVEQFFGSLTDEEAEALLYEWGFWARKKQKPPRGNWIYWLLLAGRGFGKMLSLDTPVPTPSGWTTMGDIKVGDTVFDENGRPCRVTFVSTPEIPQTAYRLHFSDGGYLDACGDHQWVTWTHAERKAFLRSPYEDTTRFPENWPQWRLKRLTGYGTYLSREVVEQAINLHRDGRSIRKIALELGVSRNAITPHIKAGYYIEPEPKVYDDSPGPRIRTTNQIVKTLLYGKRKDRNHCIPTTRPLQLPHVELPIHPYVLGVWLGDGTTNGGSITIGDEDAEATLAQLHYYGLRVQGDNRKDGSACATYTFHWSDGRTFMSTLREAGVLGNKHIPLAYLRASSGQRLDLLQGLMDTDGNIEESSTVAFCNTNIQLIDDFYELAVSLGNRPTVISRIPILNGRRCRRAYRVLFTPLQQVFRLERKADGLTFGGSQSLRRYHRMIVDAERIDSPGLMRCISVDSPNSMYLAGLGMVPTHNTKTIAHWAIDKARDMPGSRGAVVAATAADARDVLVEGASGILASSPPDFKPIYEPSKRRLTWPNGSQATIFSADQPDRLRGPQFHWAIADELAAWRYSEAWDMLQFGLRLGDNPQCAIATTPRPTAVIKELIADENCVVTHGTTYENRENLAPAFFKQVIKKYEGTRLGRQELLAQLLEDVPGALWNRALLDKTRVRSAPTCFKIVVAVDPAATTGTTGIVVVGLGKLPNGDTHGYILEDCTTEAGSSPGTWGLAAVNAYHKWQADAIVAEINHGGNMVEHVIRTVEGGKKASYRTVRASKGKYTRAEPVASLFERNMVHMVGALGLLEDELCTWVPGEDSPNRLDAMVWGVTDLMLDGKEIPAAAPASMTKSSQWRN